MAEFASAVVGPVVESLLVPVKKHMGYLFLSTQHVRKMSARMKQLEGTFDDVKNHKDTNDMNTLEVPARVPGWLEEVTKIKSDAENISSNESRCFNIKARYQMGRKAWKTTHEIDPLLQEGIAFSWTNAQKPLGRVYTRRASTSAPSSGGIGDDFKSRDTTFKDALKFLQQDQKTQMIALCGMGGVGKTTMMEQLKKVAEDKKMFDWIVRVVIGKQPNWHSIQKAVAENIGHPLTEENETNRVDRLHKRFEEILKKGGKGILVILDDVWEEVELRYVGLSPLPNGVKLLLTSRYEDICKTIAVEGNLDFKILKVNVLEQTEAHKFFCQITRISKESDPELYQIGGVIVKKCSCLPLAIKLIAPTLISEEKSIWKATLGQLRNNDLHQNVNEIIKISYDYLKDQEDKEIFLLCGLFPEDSNIPIEDLTRYAWGLKLLSKVSTVGDGRNWVIRCVRNLKNANLLIDGDFLGCVKMHDLVLAFVLDTVSKGDHASIINHGDMPNWSSEDMRESCKRISLTCRGMCEFPEGFKCPNLSLLKLMHGDVSFKFPEGFYENTKQLKVIEYEKMKYPLLQVPRPLQCSTNLRVLCLHECSLMLDMSFIGDLLNLEVLSITKCNIRKLPSTTGNLKKLKVLDLTGCRDLRIDDGILKRLVKLEELYMIASDRHANYRFTDANVELVGCSKNLTTLAIEFNALPKNISFEKLERFKISSGCNFIKVDDEEWFRTGKKSTYLGGFKFENTLCLVTDKHELLDSGMNQMFDKTEVLYLEVNGVNDIGDGLAEPLHYHHQRSLFNSLRVLSISKCANLRYLFTERVANGLTKLERLTISSCPVLETMVDGDKGGVGVIKFQALKFLSLDDLPKFTSIYPLATSSMSCDNSERRPFLNKEVVIPNLEKLRICNMKNLKEIWHCQAGSSKEVNVCMLREIIVEGCNSLVNLFPSNPMSLLHHLEKLKVCDCGSIEVLFNIDLGCAGGNIEEVSCCLRSILVKRLGNLREVWRVKGANDSDLVIRGFQAIESLEIRDCKRFRNVFTPTTTNFDMRALTQLTIDDCEMVKSSQDVFTATTTNFDMRALTQLTIYDCEMVKSSQEQEINVISIEEISEEAGDAISNVVFSSNLIHIFHNLHELNIENYKSKEAEVMFEIESSPSSSSSRVELATTPPQQPPLLPYLRGLYLEDMEIMSHVWKCNWNKFLIPHQQESFSSFHNLTTIRLWECKNIKYLFSPLMAKLLSNLKKVDIRGCDVIEEVVSNRDDEGITESSSTNTSPNLFPHLDLLYLEALPNLKRIGGGGDKGGSNEIFNNTTPTTSNIHHQFKFPQVDVVAWSLCQYAREIEIWSCQTLPYVIPSYALGQMQKLEKLTIRSCKLLLVVFENQGINNDGCCTTNIDEGSGDTDATMLIPRLQNISVPQMSNLKELIVDGCKRLQHVFTFSTIESLVQLEKLRITGCKAMEVIVKVDDEEQTTISFKTVVFPRLKSIELADLPILTGFFLGKNEFRLPLLDHVRIDGCRKMMVFTSGCSITPKLNYMRTKFGKHSLESGLNFPVMAATSHESPFSSLDSRNTCSTTSEGTPWSFHNLIELDVKINADVKNMIPSNELLQLQKLEKIHLKGLRLVEEVFEALEGTDSSELQSVVVIPKLREVELERLKNLKYLCKNNPRMVLKFPNLTKLSIVKCDCLEHVFSSSMVGSLLQLQELRISQCAAVEIIVKEANVLVEEEEECDGKVNEIIVLPRLKSIKLEKLPSLKGFCLGKEVFSWPSLDTLVIIKCPALTIFTKGDLKTPELRVIDTSFGRCEFPREQDFNSFINTKLKVGLQF